MLGNKELSGHWRAHLKLWHLAVNVTLVLFGSHLVAYPSQWYSTCSAHQADSTRTLDGSWNWIQKYHLGWLGDRLLYVALLLFGVSSLDFEWKPPKWTKPLKVRGSTPLELSWSLPSYGLFGINDALQLCQSVCRVFAYNLLVLFWTQRDFWTALWTMCLMVLYRSIFSTLQLPYSEYWKAKERIINRRAHETEGLLEDPVDVGFARVNPNNIYINLTQKFSLRCFFTFVGQVCVFCIYVIGIYRDTRVFMCDGVQRWELHNWAMFVVCLIVQFLMLTMLGAHFFENGYYWFLILTAEPGTIKIGTPPVEWQVQVEMARSQGGVTPDLDYICHPMFRVRCMMDFISNSVIYMVLLHMVPTALMDNADGMDFAKDCCAIAFITICDDLQEEERTEFLVPVPSVNIERVSELGLTSPLTG